MSVESDLKKIEKLQEKRKSEKILSYLTAKEDEVVSAAFTALGKIGDEVSTNSLAARLDDPNASIRAKAVTAFGSLHTEYAKSLLQHQVTKESDATVKEIIRKTLLTFSR